jgi:hypothetical protein
MRTKRVLLSAILLISAAIPLAGCGSTLETGYKYTRLDMTDSEQKAMYADPFSQAAAEAQSDRANEAAARRPGTPGGQY